MAEFRGWSAGVQFQPPLLQSGHLRRPRVTTRIDVCLESSPTALVVAPSGYGKTSAVAEWTELRRGATAWVTLSRLDTDPERIQAVVLRALLSLTDRLTFDGVLPLLQTDSVGGLSPIVFDRVTEAFADLAAPAHLVIDDAHHAADSLRLGLIGAMVDGAIPNLRVIVIGTSDTELALSRFALTNPRAVARSSDLAFDVDEIAALADEGGTAISADTVLQATRGWPIAVRVLTMTGVAPDDRAGTGVFHSYIRDHILPSGPPELAEFALVTSVCRNVTPALATAVTGITDSAAILARCAAAGMFIDEFAAPDCPVYRWHSVFARHCRDILVATRPDAARAALRAAASFIENDGPLEAADCWLRAELPAEAVRVVVGRWVNAIVGSDAPTLARFCTELPEPWAEDPRILLIRACAHKAAGEHHLAEMMLARAKTAQKTYGTPTGSGADYDVVLEQALLFLVDDHAALANCCDVVRERFETEAASARDRVAMLYLLGWTEMRLRRAPARATEYLGAAAVEAETIGDRALAHHSRNHLAFCLAWAGRFREAQLAVEAADTETATDTWTAYVGGGAVFTRAFVAYWENDLDAAASECIDLVRSSDSFMVFGTAARFVLALTAAASRDAGKCRLALDEVPRIPSRVDQGVAWPTFRHTALAALNEAAGNHERAMRIVAAHENSTGTPLASVVLAGIASRARQHRRASAIMHRIDHYQSISYVRAAMLLTDAQFAQHAGAAQRGHELLERALDVAADHGVRRLFAGEGADLRGMLTNHLAWGTGHEDFLAECLAPPASTSLLDALSERELAVLTQLRTTRTMQEIANHLGVSINTVKTHQRAIYRKLDVRSRREAVRIAS